MIRCRCRCGEESADGQATCRSCGAVLALSAAVAPPEPEPATAALLLSDIVTVLEGDGEGDGTLLSPSAPPPAKIAPAAGPASAGSGRRRRATGSSRAASRPARAPARAPASAPAPAPSGSSTAREPVTCATCGAQVDGKWRFCKACGSAVAAGARTRARHGLSRVSGRGEAQPPRVLREGRSIIGRGQGTFTFPQDATLSSRHAAIMVAGPTCEVVDLASTNGTFLSLRGDEPLASGDVLIIGARRLLYRRTARGHELVEILAGGEEGRCLALTGPRVVLGKDPSSDFVLADDEHVSRRHAEIVRDASGHVLRDLGSTNRTYRIVNGRRTLRDGDRVLAGAQVLEYRRMS